MSITTTVSFPKLKYLVQPRILGQEETLESTREMDSIDEQVRGRCSSRCEVADRRWSRGEGFYLEYEV